MRDCQQNPLRSLILACLPNLQTLDYWSSPVDSYLFQTVCWAASNLSKENSKLTAFRNLRSVDLKTTPFRRREGARRNLLPLVAAFTRLPNIVDVSASGVSGGYPKRFHEMPASRVTNLTLFDYDISSRNLERLLEGGKPLKSFRSSTSDLSCCPSYADFIISVLWANARSSLVKLKLTYPRKSSCIEQASIRLDGFEKLREIIIEHTFFARSTRPYMADYLPRTLETLELTSEEPAKVLYRDMMNLLLRKKKRLPKLRNLSLQGDFKPDEYIYLYNASRKAGVNLGTWY